MYKVTSLFFLVSGLLWTLTTSALVDEKILDLSKNSDNINAIAANKIGLQACTDEEKTKKCKKLKKKGKCVRKGVQKKCKKTCGKCAASLTSKEYEDIRDAIISKLRGDGDFPAAATILRLAFHDCVGGKCDGCINLNHPPNNGLAKAITILEEVYAEVTGIMGIAINRADYWALAGRVGAEFGMPNMPGHIDFVSGSGSAAQIASFVSPFATFKTGREECADSPFTTDVHEFPDPWMTHAQLFNFMVNDFGLNTTQTVAIMGAHTVGQCLPENSGWDGHFLIDPTDMATTFDNSYYKIMINTKVTWTPRNVAGSLTGIPDSKPQYSCSQDGVGCGIMLNTDFEMFYEFENLNAGTFLTECTIDAANTDCTRADTYDLAKSFAEDNDLWITAFVEAYDVMTSIGYGTSLTPIV